jgi:putative oxidoreductase
MEIGLALLRLTTGLILATHGAQKLFGWFNGPGLDVTGQFFETIGFLPGWRHALMAGLAETGGGLLLALGLFTPFGGFSPDMGQWPRAPIYKPIAICWLRFGSASRR